MKRNLLARLRSNGALYLISALLLLLGIPLYQIFVLNPAGLSTVLDNGSFQVYLSWIGLYRAQFLIYRVFLLLAFALLLTLPYSLYRIIVAQEIMGQKERAAAEAEELVGDEEPVQEDTVEEAEGEDAMPAFAWRGKGLAVFAVWAGIIGLSLYVLGSILSALYLGLLAAPSDSGAVTIASIFTITINTVGIGLFALSILFFGIAIIRSGRNLWPGSWVAFAYGGIIVAILLIASASEVPGAPTAGKYLFSTPATLLFAAWLLWLSITLVRLKSEDKDHY